MDTDLRQRLTARLAQWRVEVIELRNHGLEHEADVLAACVHELVEDLTEANTVR
jgi:hypothetical protein